MPDRMAMEDLQGKLDWEGFDYLITEMHPEQMPTEEIEDLLRQVQPLYERLKSLVLDG